MLSIYKHRWLSFLSFVAGILLLAINLWGFGQEIRWPEFPNSELRFENDQPLPSDIAKQQTARKNGEGDLEYARRMNELVASALAHINWDDLPAESYNMRVPIWENYLLHMMGRFSGIPEFEKYKFIDFERSIERGIGTCGDASMVLSQLLSNEGIDNDILTFVGHIVVVAYIDGKEYILDPDFGIHFGETSIEQLIAMGSDSGQFYAEKYTDYDVWIMGKLFAEQPIRSAGVQNFITKKYYFEYLTYFAIWFIPVVLILFSVFVNIKLAGKKSIDGANLTRQQGNLPT